MRVVISTVLSAVVVAGVVPVCDEGGVETPAGITITGSFVSSISASGSKIYG